MLLAGAETRIALFRAEREAVVKDESWRAGEGQIRGNAIEQVCMATTTDKQSLVKPDDYAYSHITKIPGVCGGYATIDGHRIRVINIVYMHNWGYTLRGCSRNTTS